MSSAVISCWRSVSSRPAKRASGRRPRSMTISRSPSRPSSDRTRDVRSAGNPRRSASSSLLVCCCMLISPARARGIRHSYKSISRAVHTDLLLSGANHVLASGDSSEGWEGQMSNERSRVTTRRRFLGAAAGVTGVLAVSAIESSRADAAGISENAATSPATTRNFARGPISLELGGVQQAVLKSADGGDTIGQVTTYRSGSDPVAHKQIGNVKYEDFALLTNFDIELPYAQWIVDMPNFQATRKNGAVVVGDFNFAVRSRREFQQALISEIGIPTLDASSKDAGYFTIGVTPEHASDGSPKGSISKKSQNG